MGDFVVVEDLDALGDADAQLHRLELVEAVAGQVGEALPERPALAELCDIQHQLIGLLYFVDFEDVGALHLHEIPVDGLLFEQVLHVLGAFLDCPDCDVPLVFLAVGFVDLGYGLWRLPWRSCPSRCTRHSPDCKLLNSQ